MGVQAVSRGYSITTSVSLDTETIAIKRRLPNFSRFVRVCLREWAQLQDGLHIIPLESNRRFGRCNPMHTNGACVICWPEGKPSRDSYFAWMAAHSDGHDPTFADDVLEIEEARVIGPANSYDEPHKKRANTPAKVGLIRKFARWIY